MQPFAVLIQFISYLILQELIMATKNRFKKLLSLAVVAMAMFAASVNAGVISYVQVTNDVDSDIFSGYTYTHAIDFGTSGAATVNGVVFATDVNVPAGGRSNSGERTYGPNPHGGGTPPAVTGDVADVFQDMVYDGPDPGYIELTGLTSGQFYDVRLYERAYSYQGVIRTFYVSYDVGSDGSAEFTTPKINQDDPALTPPGLSGDVSYVISYVYQADASGKIKIIIDLANDQTGTYHLYGLTNEDLGFADQTPPSVDAGDDMISWSGGVVTLAPIVENNSDPQTPLTYAWTADDPPDGVTVEFDPVDPVAANDPTPTVTITKALGDPVTVTLTLAVSDRVNPTPVTNTMTIDVYDDACKAAIGAGLAADNPTDLDGNCITDLKDLAIMLATWLTDTSLTAPVAK
jgi:hypothetical protein